MLWKGVLLHIIRIPSLREKCPNTEFFLVPIFLYLDWIRDSLRKSRYSVRIQENADQKKTPYLGTFYTLLFLKTPLKGCVWSLFDIDKLTDLNQSFIKFVLFNIGILVDHLKGTEFSNRSDTDLYLYHDHSFNAEESTYGLLVKDHQDYQYFSSIVRDNRRLIAACINSRFRAKKVRSAKHNNFSLKVD